MDIPSAAFFDLDGTLIKPKDDLPFPDPHNPGDFVLNRSAMAFMADLVLAGFRPIIVTNQGGIEAGHITEDYFRIRVQRFKASIKRYFPYLYYIMVNTGTSLPVYYCSSADPFDFKVKPHPGMGYQAAWEQSIYLKSSIMVGDSPKRRGGPNETLERRDDLGFANSCHLLYYFGIENVIEGEHGRLFQCMGCELNRKGAPDGLEEDAASLSSESAWVDFDKK